VAAVVGITIAVSDKELAKLQGGLKDAAGGLEGTEKKTKKSGDEMAKFAKSMLVVFGVLKLVEKGAHAVGQMFERTLAHRFDNDGLVRSVKGITQAFDRVNNSVFDQLAPLMAGIAQVAGSLAERFASFVKENERLIRIGVIEWAAKAATALGVGLVKAVALGLQAILGLEAAWQGIKVVIFKSLSALQDGLAFMLEKGAAFASALHMDETAGDLATAAKAARELGVEYDKTGEVAYKELAATAKQIDALDKGADQLADTIKKTIGQVAVAAMKNLGIQTHSTSKSMDDYKASLEADLKVLEKVMERRFKLNAQHAAELEKIADLTEADAQRSADAWTESFQRQMGKEGLSGLVEAWKMHLADVEQMNRMSIELTGKPMQDLTKDQKKNLQELTDATKAAADSIASSLSFITDPWKDFIKGTIDAATAFDRMVDAIESKILDFITSKIVEALLNVVLSIFTGGLGSVFGGALTSGLNLKSSIMASPTSNINFAGGGIPRAAAGLKITGGAPGRDSVLVRTMRDERILTPAENREWERGQRGSGGGDTMRVEYHGFPQSQAEVERWADRALVPVVRKLKLRGAWPK
jgi:hypothetical protein